MSNVVRGRIWRRTRLYPWSPLSTLLCDLIRGCSIETSMRRLNHVDHNSALLGGTAVSRAISGRPMFGMATADAFLFRPPLHVRRALDFRKQSKPQTKKCAFGL